MTGPRSAEAIRQIVTEAALADESGVDAISLGEHHRPEYAISTPETVLAGIAARTSRIRPLFGYDLADYEVLFEVKLELFVQLLDEKPVTWTGAVRTPLEHAEVYPKTDSGHLTTWGGVGGSPQPIVRTARHGLPLMLAIIGGPPERFTPLRNEQHRNGPG